MIIFDLDGTLIDSSDGILYAINCVFDIMNIEVKNGLDLTQFIGPPLKDQFIIACELTENDAKIACEIFRERYSEICLEMYSVYDGVENVLERINRLGVTMSIATQKPINQTKRILDNCQLSEMFSYIACPVSPEGISRDQLLLECINECNEKKSNVIYIGDTKSDEDAADRCGITFWAAGYGFGKGQFQKKTLVINRFEDILPMLMKQFKSLSRNGETTRSLWRCAE